MNTLLGDPSRPDRALRSSVLIVDADPVERLALSEILSPLGHPIVAAASGLDGRRCVSGQDFSVIVLDVRAPTADGFATAAFIRSREQSRLTPMIFITTIDQPEAEMTAGYAMGAVDFIVAPVIPSALRGKVSLFADLFEKTQELVDGARRLRVAASRDEEALRLQQRMLDRMDELGRAKSDFVSKISHELRSPLTSVIGYVELLLDGVPGTPTGEQTRVLKIVDRNSRRLLCLIEDLLTMSRVEAGLFELQVAPVDLRAAIEGVCETVALAVARGALSLTVDLGNDLELTGDREQIERSVLNLVSNAVKFTQPGGGVGISTRADGDDIVIAVRDTGVGIPAAEHDHLFTKFFRATRAQQEQIAGTGLGLYIVRQIVELHGGAIEVESTAAGSVFTMRLPIAGPPSDPLALVRSR